MNSYIQNAVLAALTTPCFDWWAIFSCLSARTTPEEGTPAEFVFTLCLCFVYTPIHTVSVWNGHIYSINKQHVVCNMLLVCHKHGSSFTVNKAYNSVTLVPFIEDVTIDLVCLSKGQKRQKLNSLMTCS